MALRRPRSGTPAAAARDVPARVAQGRSTAGACRDCGLEESAFYALLLDDVELAERFERARRISADVQFDEIQDLERRVIDRELDASTLRAVVDARKWRLSRAFPAVYGDKAVAPVGGLSRNGTSAASGGLDASDAPCARNGSPNAAVDGPEAEDLLPDLSGLTPEQLLELTRRVFGAGGEGACREPQ